MPTARGNPPRTPASPPPTGDGPPSLARQLAAPARVFKALGQPTRLFMIQELGRGERCVQDLQRLVGADMSTISKHLGVLREAGLVRDERRGNQVFYRLTAPCVLDFMDCVARVTGEPVVHQLGGAPATPAAAGGGPPGGTPAPPTTAPPAAAPPATAPPATAAAPAKRSSS